MLDPVGYHFIVQHQYLSKKYHHFNSYLLNIDKNNSINLFNNKYWILDCIKEKVDRRMKKETF